MEIKFKKPLFFKRKRLLILFMRTFIFLCFSSSFGYSPNISLKKEKIELQEQINGTVLDNNGQPLPGVNVVEKGTTNGVQTDFDGNFTINTSNTDPILVISYIGFKTKEVSAKIQTALTIVLEEDVASLEEVVVVGYGTQKKVNLTASVTQIGAEVFENRPVSSAARSLQGAVSNLQVTNNSNGGQPGATPDINIRGFITSSADGDIGEATPLILIDGIEMSLNQIDPEDIESVSVLKDAAAASIYGSRAASGAIVIITKSGKNMNGGMKVSYSNNFSLAQPTQWPESASAINFAYAMNDARANIGASDWYTEEELGWIIQNTENPGSAPTLVSNAAGTAWDQSNAGLGATASTDWKDFFLKDWAQRRKHNINFTGGDEKLNYYISTGLYQEEGLLTVGDESYERFNVDAKIAAKPKDWLSFELLTKFLKSNDDFPWDPTYGTGRIFDLLSKVKPTLPIVDPFGEPLVQAYYPYWENQREENTYNQIALLPRVTLEPVKDWLINLQYNYKRNNNRTLQYALTTTYLLPDGSTAYARSQEQTAYNSSLITNEYYSPNLFTTYTKSLGNHNFKILAGYQNEVYNYYALAGSVSYLITDNVLSLETSLDDTPTVSEAISHWSTESVFSRFNYDYKGKYLFEFSYRRDGSSRFEPDNRWAGFPSYSLGYNLAKENFWPFKESVSTFKLRGSYGTLGNQNVDNYLYLSTIPITSPGTQYLFDGERAIFASAPDLVSNNLTWETVQTTDFGIDIIAFNNKLNVALDWYRTDIDGMAAQGLDLPAVLGTTAPLTNIGVSRVQGWEAEISWQQKINENFSYNVKAVLSDYKRSIVEYPNDTKLLSNYYNGRDLGEVWGLQWDGWFQTQDEVDNRIDQSFVAGNFTIGDTKYVDVNNDGVIDRGTNTLGDSGDFTVIANTTPRYQYSLNLGLNYKNFDFNMFLQGIGKRDVLVSNHQRFRGPAQGPFHAMVFEEHLDYFRPEDTSSPLGPNTDSYFPKPYAANPGNNNRNYNYNVDRYIQNGAYARLKSLQIGYTIPKEVTDKSKINKIRLFLSGENLFTVSSLLFYDPESLPGNYGSAQSYPLSRVVSIGLNTSF